MIAFARQLSLLLEMRRQTTRPPHQPADLAKISGVPLQTLLYLLEGRSLSPRLDTAHRICSSFEITLDYFDCDTEADCKRYLMHQWLISAPTNLQEIAAEVEQLTPRGQRNALSMIELIKRALH